MWLRMQLQKLVLLNKFDQRLPENGGLWCVQGTVNTWLSTP